MAWLCFFKTRLPSSKTLGLTFLLNARSMRHWYNYPWHIAVMHFSSIMFSCSYRERAHLASDNSIWDKILRDRISTSTGRMASMPYTKEYGVEPVKVQTHKCDMRIKQTASTHASPCMCLSFLPRFSLCSCQRLPLHHSSEGDREPNFCAQSWIVGRVSGSFSHLGSPHYL